MAFTIFLLVASVYIRAALGGALKVIDYDRQCVIWSDDNHGCTGYSASFGLLDGNDCSGELYFYRYSIGTNEGLDLSNVTHGIRKEYSKLNVDTCGTENGQPVAWIQVNDNGVVKFHNQNGNKAGCTLDNGLKVGSSCIASNLPSWSSSLSSTSPESSSPESSLPAFSPSSTPAPSGSISTCPKSE